MKNWRRYYVEKRRIRREAFANFVALHKWSGKFINKKWQNENPKIKK